MKLIDKEGRLFGKLNIIDLLVLIVIASILPLAYVGHKVLTKPVVIAKEKARLSESIEVYCKLEGITPEIAKVIKVGDKEITTENEVLGEILELGSLIPTFDEMNLGDNNVIKTENPTKFNVIAKMRLFCYRLDNLPSYKTDSVRINSRINFCTSKYTLSGPILSIYPLMPVYVKVYLLLKDLDRRVVEKIKVGDLIIDKQKNQFGRITEMGPIEHNIKFQIQREGLVIKEDPLLKQVLIRVELRGSFNKDGIPYYDNRPIGSTPTLEIRTEKYIVYGEVMNASQK